MEAYLLGPFHTAELALQRKTNWYMVLLQLNLLCLAAVAGCLFVLGREVQRIPRTEIYFQKLLT